MPLDKAVIAGIRPDMPALAGAFSRDVNRAKILGQAALNLFMAFIVITIIAVVLSPASNSAGVIGSFFNLLNWLVEQVVSPVGQGSVVSLSPTNSSPADTLSQTAAPQGAAGSSTPTPAQSGADLTNTGVDTSLGQTGFAAWLSGIFGSTPAQSKPAPQQSLPASPALPALPELPPGTVQSPLTGYDSGAAG